MIKDKNKFYVSGNSFHGNILASHTSTAEAQHGEVHVLYSKYYWRLQSAGAIIKTNE